MDSFQAIENVCTAEVTRDISQPIQEMIQPERTEFTRNISQPEITESRNKSVERKPKAEGKPVIRKTTKSSKGEKKTHSEGQEGRTKSVALKRKAARSVMSKNRKSSKGEKMTQPDPEGQEDRDQSAGQEPKTDGGKRNKSSKGEKKALPETEGQEDRSKFVGQNRKIDGESTLSKTCKPSKEEKMVRFETEGQEDRSKFVEQNRKIDGESTLSKSSNSSKGDTNAQLGPKRQEDRSKSVAQKPETDSEPAMSKSSKSSKVEKRIHPEGQEGGTKSVGRKPQTTGESAVRKSSKFLKGDKNNVAQPPTSEMVIESIKSLKMRNGATEKAICKYIEENYNVNINVRSRHIKKSLMNGVETGLLENVCRDGVTERFKIKKESTKKLTERKRNLLEEKLKDAKKVKKSAAPGKKAKE